MNYFIFLLLLFFNFGFLKAIEIKGLAYLYDIKVDMFNNIIKAYNKYSKENNLDITLDVELFTSANTTIYEDFSAYLEALFKNKSSRKRYDIFFYFDTYRYQYGKQFINLFDYLSEDRIDIYERSILNEGCILNNNLIGLPLFFDTNVLYSNTILLDKYEKEIPKTWDQLIETAEFIRDQEKDLYNNTDFDPYIGGFSREKSEEGAMSFYEVIASCRNSNEAPFPKESSKEFREGMKIFKKIKDSLFNTDNNFETDLQYIIKRFYSGKALFVKFYMASHPSYFEPSVVPGLKEGVTGTLPGAYLVSVNRYIDNDRINKTLGVLDFFTSKKVQKEYILKQNVFSAITELYYDPETCKKFKCEVFLQSRPFTKLSSNYRQLNFEKYWYSYTVLDYVFQYIYDKVSLDKAMDNIINLLKIYHFSTDANDSLVGFSIFIVYITLVILIAISIVIILIISVRKKKSRSFMSTDFWLISVLGTIVMLTIMLSLYGPLSSEKCHMKVFVWSFSFSMFVLPSVNQLIVNFPSRNKVSSFLEKGLNRYIFFFLLLLVDILFNSLLYVWPFKIKNIINIGGKNFQLCSMKSGLGVLSLVLLCLLKIGIILGALVLVFIEWNIKETSSEIKVVSSLLLIKIFEVLTYISYCSINFKNYDTYCLLFCGIVIVFALTSYIFVIRIKLISLFTDENGMTMEDMIKQSNKLNENAKNINANNNNQIIKSSEIIENSSDSTKALPTSSPPTDLSRNESISNKHSRNGSVSNKHSRNESVNNKVNSEDSNVNNNVNKKNLSHENSIKCKKNNIDNVNILIKYHYKESKD